MVRHLHVAVLLTLLLFAPARRGATGGTAGPDALAFTSVVRRGTKSFAFLQSLAPHPMAGATVHIVQGTDQDRAGKVSHDRCR